MPMNHEQLTGIVGDSAEASRTVLAHLQAQPPEADSWNYAELEEVLPYGITTLRTAVNRLRRTVDDEGQPAVFVQRHKKMLYARANHEHDESTATYTAPTPVPRAKKVAKAAKA